MKARLTIFFLMLAPSLSFAQGNIYPWLKGRTAIGTIASHIQPPQRFERFPLVSGTFAHWLRYLPLKEKGAPVFLFNGRMKPNQEAHFAVIDIDPGTRDLQQCADAVIRLRAEYLYSKEKFSSIHFNFTSGDKAYFTQWAEGYRPIVKGNNVTWAKKADMDASYFSFRQYLDIVFTYAGSYSLGREMEKKQNPNDIEIGDVFIEGGFPGHAVLVVDMAENFRTGEKVFLLVQSYMPAQDIHILKNPTNPDLSPWYKIPSGDILDTPEWTFTKAELRYFKP